MTVEAAQAAIEAAAAAEQAATDERARAEAAAAKQAEEKRKELMEQNKGAAAIQARIRGRSLRKSRSAPPPLFVPQGIPAAWAPLCRVVDKPVLLSAARLQGYISAIFEAKLVSDAACDREGRRRPPFTQLAHFTLQSTPPGQDRAAASHTLASMLVSAANYEALPGARPEGSLRVELFAIVAGMAGLGPLGPGKYSAHAATFFFDVLSAALFPPAEWKGLLALSEGGLSLPTTPIAGQRALAEAVQLIGLPLAFERKLHAELEASSEAEWGGAGRNVEVGRKVRVDVMLQKAMDMYFGQMAVSRLNWEHNFDAAVPVEPKILRSFSEFRTVLRQTIEDRPKTNKGQVGRLHDAGGGLAAIAKGLADKGSGPPEAELNISDEAVRELYLLAIERHDEMGKGEGKELRPDHICRDAFVQVVVETGLQARDGGVVCSSRSLTNQLGQKARAAGGSGPAAAGGGGWAAAAAVATLGGKSGGSKKASLLQLARAAATVEDKQRSAAMTAFQKGL